MKKKRIILLKIVLLFVALVSLLAFSQINYGKREVKEVTTTIDYSRGNHFITDKVVNRLLKQTHIDFPQIELKRISIDSMERNLVRNPFVKSANVYMKNNGELHTDIIQEVPVVRIKSGNEQFYLTEDGRRIPLSSDYAAQVFLVSGKVDSTEYEGLSTLAQMVDADKLLKNNIIGASKQGKNSFNLSVTSGAYKVHFGKLENIEEKLDNYKIFKNKYIDNQEKMPYSAINLNYNKQVIAIR